MHFINFCLVILLTATHLSLAWPGSHGDKSEDQLSESPMADDGQNGDVQCVQRLPTLGKHRRTFAQESQYSGSGCSAVISLNNHSRVLKLNSD